MFGLHPEAVSRHFKAHVHAALQKHALKEKETLKRGTRLEEQLNYISDKAQSILETAERAGNFGVALAALKELRESARLAAIAAGELEDGGRTTLNVQINHHDPVDEASNARSYLEIIGCPPDLVERVLAYVTAPNNTPLIEGQVEEGT